MANQVYMLVSADPVAIPCRRPVPVFGPCLVA